MCCETVETYSADGVTGRVEYDRDATNPLSDWDHAWTLIGDTGCPASLDEDRRGGAHYSVDFSEPDWIRNERSPGDTVALLRVDDYGSRGVLIHRASCLEDCNAIAMISAATITKEWNGDRAAAYRYLEGILSTLNSYYEGDVYGFVVEGPDGEVLDSCWGFVGEERYATSEMKDSVDHYAERIRNDNLLAGLAQLAPYAPAL